jgi:glyoxylase I family protein
MDAPVLGVNHVNLLVTDLAAAREFYGHVLGLTELPRPDFGPGVWYSIGNVQLHLSVVAEMPAGTASAFAHLALQLPTDRFRECVDGIVARGAVLSRDPQTREQLGAPVQTAFLRDPFANLIELTDAGGS